MKARLWVKDDAEPTGNRWASDRAKRALRLVDAALALLRNDRPGEGGE